MGIVATHYEVLFSRIGLQHYQDGGKKSAPAVVLVLFCLRSDVSVCSASDLQRH